MKDLLQSLIEKLVDNPKDVSIEEITNNSEITKYRITVNPSDVGKVIGKKGKNLGALRTIFQAIGAKESKGKKRIIIESDDF